MSIEDIKAALHAESASDEIHPPDPRKQKKPNPNGSQKVNGAPEHKSAARAPARPVAMSVEEILALEAPERQMLVETLVPRPGAVMLMGSHKSGKTVLAVQIAIAAASGHPLMDNYRITEKCPVIVIEQDDSAGEISMRDYLRASPVPVRRLPLHLFTKIKQRFGPDFCSWLESEICGREARLVILDSYTALRPHRHPGTDLVKVEQEEVALLDELGKRHNSTIIILHHVSKGSFGMDWSDQGAGTFSIGAASEGQIHIARFKDFPGNAPERLIQGRGRHLDGFEAVIRFRKNTLDYEVVLEGAGAPIFVELCQLRNAFEDRIFSPKECYQELGMSRTNAFRLIGKLTAADVLERQGYGQYRLVPAVLRQLRGRSK
jgi:hypothetical protein